jgi:hypothetical protein
MRVVAIRADRGLKAAAPARDSMTTHPKAQRSPHACVVLPAKDDNYTLRHEQRQRLLAEAGSAQSVASRRPRSTFYLVHTRGLRLNERATAVDERQAHAS